MRLFLGILWLVLGLACAEAQQTLSTCEWCGVQEAPTTLSWQTTIPNAEEAGEPLIITGTVFAPDGQTPVPNVVVYVYHTNEAGIYPKRGDETGNARRHGYLRGWMRTNAQGQYHLTTIRPRAYPSRTEPAHIHMTLQEPDGAEHWVDSIVFAGDPLLRPDTYENRGGSGIVALRRDDTGVWRGVRNVILIRSK